MILDILWSINIFLLLVHKNQFIFLIIHFSISLFLNVGYQSMDFKLLKYFSNITDIENLKTKENLYSTISMIIISGLMIILLNFINQYILLTIAAIINLYVQRYNIIILKEMDKL